MMSYMDSAGECCLKYCVQVENLDVEDGLPDEGAESVAGGDVVRGEGNGSYGE